MTNNNLKKNESSSLEKLKRLNLAYEKGEELISDSEFEVLLKDTMNELCISREEAENSYISNSSKKNKNYLTHPTQIFRIDKVYNKETLCSELEKKKVSSSDCLVLESKVDGIMINLVYVEGLLTKAITRGDKYGGEDITRVLTAVGVPLTISKHSLSEVRGELYLTNTKYNTHHSSFSSPRAALLSLVKTLTTSREALSTLSFVAHDLVLMPQERAISRSEKLETLESWGFSLPYFKRVRFGELDKTFDDFFSMNRSSDIPIDGIIVRTDSASLSSGLDKKYKDKLGSALAVKESLSFVTRVLSVDYTMGKTGKITPMINISPISTDSIICTRLSMYSMDFFQKSGVGVGSDVSVLYHGIFVFDCLVGSSVLSESDFKSCFSCKGDLMKEGLHLFCMNSQCPVRLAASITAFCNTVGVSTLSKQTISLLIESGVVSSVADLFLLDQHVEKINSLKGFKGKRLDNILDAMKHVSANLKAADLIFALGIEGLGLKTCSEIGHHFQGFQNVDWDRERVLTVYQVKTIKAFLSHDRNLSTLASLQSFFPNL